MKNEILERYQKLVGMIGKIHPDWDYWLYQEIVRLEKVMEGQLVA